MFLYTTFLNEEIRGAPCERESSRRCPAFHDSQRLPAVSIETEASESWSLNFNDLWQRRGLMEPWQSQHTPTKTHRQHPLITDGEWGWGRRCFTLTNARTRPNRLKGRWHQSHETMRVSGHVEPPRLAELALKANVKTEEQWLHSCSDNIPLNNMRVSTDAIMFRNMCKWCRNDVVVVVVKSVFCVSSDKGLSWVVYAKMNH